MLGKVCHILQYLQSLTSAFLRWLLMYCPFLYTVSAL